MFDPNWTLKDTFAKAQADKVKVGVYLTSGTLLTGLVGGVGDHHVLLTQLAGKEFYDAVVRIEEIAAVEARVRTK